MKLIFDGKEFCVICCCKKYDKLISVDADFKDNIDEFLLFIKEHSLDKGKFDFSISENDYTGWFGAYNFDKTGKIRFYLAVYDKDNDNTFGNIGSFGDNIEKSIKNNRDILKEIALKVLDKEQINEFFTREMDYCINYPSFYVEDLEAKILKSGKVPFGKLE